MSVLVIVPTYNERDNIRDIATRVRKHGYDLLIVDDGSPDGTGAIADEIAAGRDVYGYRFRGQRFDCGSKAGFLQATVAFGLARPDLRDEFSHYLEEMMAVRNAAQ